jgi:dodecin
MSKRNSSPPAPASGIQPRQWAITYLPSVGRSCPIDRPPLAAVAELAPPRRAFRTRPSEESERLLASDVVQAAADAPSYGFPARSGASSGEVAMSIVRSIEVIAQSPKGFDDACRQAVKEASTTLRGIRSFWIKNAECIVEDDEIAMFRINGKISFEVERSEPAERGSKAKTERAMAGDKPRR